MKRLIFLTLPILLAACATTGRASLEGPARIGQTVRVDGPTVRPLAVIEDSRCPSDAVCVWAGRVIVRVVVRTGQGKQEMELEMGQPMRVADGMLTLREVTPGRRHDQPLKPADYRFTFEFAGAF